MICIHYIYSASNIILEIVHGLAVFSWRFRSVDKYKSDGRGIKDYN